MDLAICWETPIDPQYEPQKSIHIDGTDGGPAPSIFTLVPSSDTSKIDVRDGCIPGQAGHGPCNHCNTVSIFN